MTTTPTLHHHFWLRAECKPDETRTPLLPEHVASLIKAGHRVTVEASPARCVKDAEYKAVPQVTMVATGSWPSAPKDAIIVGLKELPQRPMLLQHQHVHFAHCYKGQKNWAETLLRYAEGEGKLWDLEFLRNVKDHGSLDDTTLLQRASTRVVHFDTLAGFVGMALGILDWAAIRGQQPLQLPSKIRTLRGILVQHCRDVLHNATQDDTRKLPTIAIIAPRGRCGRGAVDLCRKIGLPDANVQLWDRKEIRTGGPFCKLVTDVDIVCNCIRLTDAITTPFLTPALLDRDNRRLTVIVDVSCDVTSHNNPLPIYTRATSVNNPIQVLRAGDKTHAPLHLCAVDHLPSFLPYVASYMIGNMLVPLLLCFGDTTLGPWRYAKLSYDHHVAILRRTHSLDTVQKHMLQRYLQLDTLTSLDALRYYPHKIDVTHTPRTYRKAFEHVEREQSLTDTHVTTAGRVTRANLVGNKLYFIAIEWDGATVQLMWENSGGKTRTVDTWWFNHVRLGDVVAAQGYPHRTRRGELSVRVQQFHMLAPCVRPLPQSKAVITSDLKYRQRYVYLLRDPKARAVFQARSRLVDALRTFLKAKAFMEVETPLLNPIAGGANAKPFITHHNALDMDFFMRIAPELYLKQLIVSGFPKVFEIGKNLRNENMDGTHNPEYTACELYWALADYNDLITLTETLLPTLVKAVTGGSLKLKIRGKTINFKPPYKRIRVLDGLRKAGVALPSEFDSDVARKQLDTECARLKIDCATPRTTARLLDALISELLEAKCVHPTFVMEHPQIMSPLAKWHRSVPHVTERFELFILGKEILNAYTELNDPRKQRQLFALQEKDAKEGDDEAHGTDESFCQALEYGLPPTAGWGLGVDRLVMFLTNSESIKDVLLFPTIRPMPLTTLRHVPIVIFGSGQCTPVLLADLTQNPEHRITVYTDQEKQAHALIKRVVRPERQANVRIAPLVVSDALADNDDFIAQLKTYQLAISMLPPFLHPPIAKACIKARVHLLTPSYVSPAMRALDTLARQAGVMVLNELGLDPGLDHLLTLKAMHAIRKENNNEATVVSVKSQCGALARLDTALTSPFLYKFSWSPEGVLRAFSRPAKVVRNGKVKTITSPYDQWKPLNLCGLALEAVANADSSEYVDAYFANDQERAHGTIERNTLRLKGTIEAFSLLRGGGLFDNVTVFKKDSVSPRQFTDIILPTGTKLVQLLQKAGLREETPVIDTTGLTALQVTARFLGKRYAVAKDDRDMTIMHIVIDYHKNMLHASSGLRHRRTATFIEYGNARTTSVARLVGQCVSAAALAILKGEINPSAYLGVQRPLHSNMVEPILKRIPLRSLKVEDVAL